MDHISVLGARVVAYKPILRSLGIASTVTGTLLASQLLWEYQQHGRQPFHIADIELASRIGLTVDEIRTARQDITRSQNGADPCFSYQRRGFPTKGFWDVDEQALNARFSAKPQCSSQFGPAPEQQPSVRASSRTEENPVAATVRASSRTGATGPKPSEDSSSGHSPHQFGPEPEQSLYENSLEEKSFTPYPLQGGTPPAAAVTNTGAKPKRATKVNPATAPLPACLEQHREAIADFWAAKRTGSARTPRAFELLVGQLEQIHAADPVAVATQLNAATQAGWSSITYANWQRYGRATQKTGNGSHLIGGSRQSHNAAMVIASIHARRQQPNAPLDPISAALQDQQRRIAAAQAITVEVQP